MNVLQHAVDNIDVSGYADEGYEAVVAEFIGNFRLRGETGAACCIYHGGKRTVDMIGGSYLDDSLQLLRSATKGVVSIIINMLAERGCLDMDAPVASIWPQFAQSGKQDMPVRLLFTHQAGLPSIDRRLTFSDVIMGTGPVDAVARQCPQWEPGTSIGYHDFTLGVVAGELVHRLTDMTLGTFLQKEISVPLSLDLWVGLPARHLDRVLPIRTNNNNSRIDDKRMLAQELALTNPDSLLSKSQHNPDLLPFEDTATYVAAEIPAANGVSNARSLAKLYAATLSKIDGVRLLSSTTVKRASMVHAAGLDLLVGYQRRYGMGFMLPDPTRPMAGIDTNCFGHYGRGGTVAFADPDLNMSFAYTTIQDQIHPASDPRTALLARAARSAVLHIIR